MTSEEFKHSFKTPFHDSLGLAVYSSGLQRCGAGHSWGPAVRNHYTIHYIVSGRGWFDDGQKRYFLSSGDGFMFGPNHLVSYQADQDDPWEYCWIGFNGTDAARLVQETGLSREKPLFHYDKDDTLQKILTRIYDMTGSRPCDEARMLSGLLEFLSVLMEEFGDTLPARHRNGYEYVEKSIRFIDYNYSRDDIDINDIAANAGISRSHLYRLFMQHISMPPNEYLTHYRIDKAAYLLRHNNLSVGEAAYSTGFSDQLYFSRVFKKYKGVPPSRYAELNDSSSSSKEDKNERSDSEN